MQEYDESFFRAKANKRAGITWLLFLLRPYIMVSRQRMGKLQGDIL
jgi:hypothetical protein